jgi:aspartate racemase
MPVLESILGPPGIDARVRRFKHYEAAVRAMADYQAELCAHASRQRSNGLRVTDQDQREEVFCLFPAGPHTGPYHPPLAIVGGMGPLAGALAFRHACARFEDSRAVVLYQACSVPDRSTVILSEGSPGTVRTREMALRLAEAVRVAVDLISPASQPARCIIACNTAHYFWRLVTNELQESAATLQMISLVESSVEALRLRSSKRALLLTTEGARVGEVFSAPCRDAGIVFDELSPALSDLLMKTVFEGVKSLDERRAVSLGNEFFRAILQSGRDYDCVLAGCTELPLTIDLLRRRGIPAVAAFLSCVRIVDPLEEAFCHA